MPSNATILIQNHFVHTSKHPHFEIGNFPTLTPYFLALIYICDPGMSIRYANLATSFGI